jgi:hypothetical protein
MEGGGRLKSRFLICVYRFGNGETGVLFCEKPAFSLEFYSIFGMETSALSISPLLPPTVRHVDIVI